MVKLFRTVSALWKQGWNEIPEVMGSSFFGVVGLVGLYAYAFKFYMTENRTKRYKFYYTIMRPDDPKVAKLWRYENSPAYTSTR